jgi:hypothetical protein
MELDSDMDKMMDDIDSFDSDAFQTKLACKAPLVTNPSL